MTDDKQAIANLMHGSFVLGGVMLGLYDFARALIAHGIKGGSFDEDALTVLRNQCIVNVKNSDVAGFPIQQESVGLGQIVQQLQTFADKAIAEGRKMSEE